MSNESYESDTSIQKDHREKTQIVQECGEGNKKLKRQDRYRITKTKDKTEGHTKKGPDNC